MALKARGSLNYGTLCRIDADQSSVEGNIQKGL